MKIVCPNCNGTLSCGCQKRMASNGVQVCSNCIISYEASLKNSPAQSTTTLLYNKSSKPNTIDSL